MAGAATTHPTDRGWHTRISASPAARRVMAGWSVISLHTETSRSSHWPSTLTAACADVGTEAEHAPRPWEVGEGSRRFSGVTGALGHRRVGRRRRRGPLHGPSRNVPTDNLASLLVGAAVADAGSIFSLGEDSTDAAGLR